MTNEQYSKLWSEAYTQGWCDSFQNNHKWAKERIKKSNKYLLSMLKACKRPTTTSADEKLFADVQNFIGSFTDEEIFKAIE